MTTVTSESVKVTQSTTREPMQTVLVSKPGGGKTYSFRNMDPETCGFINQENKPLPFPNKFKHYVKPKNWRDGLNTLIEFAKNPAITEVVHDSFSSYIDSLLMEARNSYKAYDIWNFYNEEIGKLLNIYKRYPKDLFVTAHYEILTGEDGTVEKRIKTKGNEWSGWTEKEFTIVLFGEAEVINDNVNYFYRVKTDGKNSAKCPPHILGETIVKTPNDCKFILDQIRKNS